MALDSRWRPTARGGRARKSASSGVEPPPVIFRSEVNYVEVDASVTNAAGEVVNDLTERDFVAYRLILFVNQRE